MIIPTEQDLALLNTAEQKAGELKLNGTAYSRLPATTQRELERLTESLFLGRSTQRRRSVIFVEMDPAVEVAVWLSTGVASVLSSMLQQTVFVLAVNSDAAMKQRPAEDEPEVDLPRPRSSYLLEEISASGPQGSSIGALIERLQSLRAEGYPVVVHLPHSEDQLRILGRAHSVDGVVLLTRASRTRKAALLTMQRRLADMNVPLLGSVLLDRQYPVPGALYRKL